MQHSNNDRLPFVKMHGAGNDYVYIDSFHGTLPDDLSALARAVADRHRGVGGDGLIAIHPSTIADARMQMLNADGSEAEMCGNGIRCVAKYLYDRQLVAKERLTIETLAGCLDLDLVVVDGKVARVRVDMGEPRLAPEQIPTTLIGDRQMGDAIVDVALAEAVLPGEVEPLCATCVSMGNPHCVIFVPEVTDFMVHELGPRIERSEVFPQRTNVEFVQVVTRGRVKQRTWERGSGETLACGTGASAVCVAGHLSERTDRQLEVELLGGTLELEWNEENNHIYMTGPAVEVFQGSWPLAARLPTPM